MGDALVIVESPAKAKTIAGYLGDGFVVESSIGHVRDLPMRASDVPAAYKGEPWAKTGVDVDNDFKPIYVVSPQKKDQIRTLKHLLADADELYLATDEDREGEAIAWHLLEVLNPRVPVKRMVFHEITPAAIRRALDETREIDRRLVDAQEARRLLDRLYGYEISPVLWKKITTGLSAGRVQSVATRIVVERERERMAFVPADYWDLDLTLTVGETVFDASLVEVDGRRVASGGDFGDDGTLARAAMVLDEATVTDLAAGLAGETVEVASVESKPYRRRPAAPFITSTFQQEAGRRAGRCPTGSCCRSACTSTVSPASPAAAGGPVHHLHVPTGGRSAPEALGGPRHACRPGPLPEGLHHLHADRQHDPVGHRPARRPGGGRGALRP